MKSMLEDFDGDDEELEKLTPTEGCFEAVSPGRRAAILFAGPFFNFLLAFVGAVIIIGTVGYDPAEVTYVAPNSSAEAVGLQEGDLITSFNGKHVDIGRDIAVWTAINELEKGDMINITYIRDGEEYVSEFDANVTVRYMMGITYSQTAENALIQAVQEGSPIAEAGVQAGDIITEINGTEITTPQSMQEYFTANPMDGTEMTVSYERDGEISTVSFIPYRSESVNLGFSYNLGRVSTNPLGVLKYSFIEIRYQISTVLESLKGLFTGRFTVNDMSGPVGIVDMVGDAYEESKSEGAIMTWMNMINMIVLLSANLGVMNLLPIPGVDGGKLVGTFIEAIRGKRISVKVESMVTTVTAVLLLALMLYIMYHDITLMLP